MKISPARTAAFDILRRIETERAFSSILLSQLSDEISGSDRALCHELVLGTLRRQIYLDCLTDSLAKSKKLDIEIRIILRLGLYQLLYLAKIPAYSAINESVNLAARARKTSAKGFVNAVLRRASADPPELRFSDEIERVSVGTSHPRWLIEKWVSDIGLDETDKLSAANNEMPPTAFRVINDSPVEIRTLLAESRKSAYVDGCYITASPGRTLRDATEKGFIYIQDEASQLTAHWIEVGSGGRILDVCAAPGGKTSLIARNNPACLVVAGDIHRSRVEFLRANCLRQQVSVSVIQYDATNELPLRGSTFDAVLVDAPCSGTGTIRHNPELRYFLNKDDFDALSAKQLLILKNASKHVKLGGRLVYSTCSLESEENEAVCNKFLKETQEFFVTRPDVPVQIMSSNGFARTRPHRDNMDGFFIACFERRI